MSQSVLMDTLWLWCSKVSRRLAVLSECLYFSMPLIRGGGGGAVGERGEGSGRRGWRESEFVLVCANQIFNKSLSVQF